MKAARHAFASLSDAIRYLTAGSWKRALLGLGVLAVLAVIGLILFLSAGFASVSARSGHWSVTGWVLHATLRASVRTQSLGIEAPSLTEPSLILRGAGHYQSGCAPCHGGPGQERSLVARQMTPTPPYLPAKIKEWDDRELFWIVRNGIKFSGMPAWPAPQRKDEVWAVVAFIRQLPDMSDERYLALTHGPTDERGLGGLSVTPDHLRRLADPFGPVLANCARCHGEDGLGRGEGAFPKLAGQNEAYLLASLKAYANGERHSGIMQPIAAGLDTATLEYLASHYASLPARSSQSTDATAETPGLPKNKEDIPQHAAIPVCQQCHGPAPTERNPRFPNLAGQHADYLALQLELFQRGHRGGSDYANIMHNVARRLTQEQIRELAEFYADLEWGQQGTPLADAGAPQTEPGTPESGWRDTTTEPRL